MSANWPFVRLGDYCLKIGSGATPKGGKSVYLDAGQIALIRSQNVYNDTFKPDGLAYITLDAANKLKNVEVQLGDILLNITGDSVARLCLAPDEYLPARVNQHVAIIRPDPDEFDSRFLRYFLTSPEQQELLLAIASAGATRNALTKSHIESLEVCKPELAVQTWIAIQLESFDKKIQLNHQINQSLEQMAQALFKSWFVDFEPVKAKMAVLEAGGSQEDATFAAMTAISGKDADALALFEREHPEQHVELKATAELFPSAMQDSELGEIPAGWTTPAIQDVASTVKGKSYKSTELDSSKTALVTLKSFNRGGGYRLDGLKEYTGKYKPDQEVFAGDLIIAYTDVTQAADVIGKPAMVISDTRYKHLVISLDVAVVRPFNDNLKYYLYGVARTEQFQNHTNSHSTGTTVLHLSKNAVPNYKFILANEEWVDIYAKHVKSIFSKINITIEESNFLSELRDTLLPKLLSGEITLPDAEQAVSEAENV
ncbi:MULTISPECIES: restriction endonuclease subunit S [Pantoea]|uniref:Type I restriction modification DNA specificity domain-containing protein n=2 Tax=Pantoea TaxID=53335 RepID=A0A0U3UVM6_9GAMM|nr:MULTISPECIES: restriction endonuclease subunit S [Pantoea]ALV90961.1 hypothetical protein LK04_01830 [Pantoea vagans]KHJ69403.1 hypothetical protein QU24_03645 [Pantoea rodasii]